MSSWHSYPKVWNMGHAAIEELFYDEIIVEEKIDGSQFSFGLINGELKVRSKGKEMELYAPEKMFQNAIDVVISLKDKLMPNYTYRAEYLQKPKHNVLCYDRIPKNHLIIFDINVEEEKYLSREEKEKEAERLELEYVPLLYKGKISSYHDLAQLLDKTSCLGGQKIEGFVVKNYNKYGKDKKVLLGKHVSESFKEKHKVDWKIENPGQNDIIENLINTYRTPARWDKAIIHLKEMGELENTPKDISKIIKEVPKDLLVECENEIKEALFNWAYPKLIRGVNKGLAEYYKEKLFKLQFGE